MQEETYAFIFSPFTNDFRDHPFSGDQQFEYTVDRLCCEYLPDYQSGSFREFFAEPLTDELLSQELTYLYCLSIAERIKLNPWRPATIAGYSMGLYAALCFSGSIEYDKGLHLLREAWRICSKHTRDRRYGMASVIGLERQDIETLVQNQGLDIVITNQNADFSWVISGKADEISQLCTIARSEGALGARPLVASIPYHHPFLAKVGDDFREVTDHLVFRPAETPLISVIDHKVIRGADEIKEEVIRNLYTPLCWKETYQYMERFGITTFVECGPTRQLIRNAKFLKGMSKFTGPEIFR